MSGGDILLAAAGGDIKTVESWFNWRTFSPERRARAAVDEYGAELDCKRAWLIEAGATDEQVEQWTAGYVKRWLAYQYAGSRTMNWMITGPARFPVERNNKRLEIEMKRGEELSQYADGCAAWLRRQENAQARREASEAAKGQEFATEEICGVRLVMNTALDRVQLIFPGKPDEEMRRELKRSAFRWSPREGAWQRQLTRNGVWAAREIMASIAAEEA